jgi:ATP-dependent DNA helicase RecG
MKAKEIAPGKLTRTLCALANADGGEVFVGIHGTPFTWTGFANEEAANAHIQLIEELFPIGSVTRCQFLACPPAGGPAQICREIIPLQNNEYAGISSNTSI